MTENKEVMNYVVRQYAYVYESETILSLIVMMMVITQYLRDTTKGIYPYTMGLTQFARLLFLI